MPAVVAGEPQRNEYQTRDDSGLVANLGQHARRDRHEKIAHVVGELYTSGLSLGKLQRILEVLVQKIHHAVAAAPQEKQRRDKGEGKA